VLCLVLLPLSYSNAQVDPTTGLTLNDTGNILNLGGGLPWSGTVTGSAGGYSGGSTPAYNPSTGNLIFGYTQSTVSQRIGINQALANAGTGIELAGYKYQWQIQNDLYNSGSNRGTLTGNVSLTGPTGNVLESFNYNYNQNLSSFTTFKGTQYFNNRYDTTSASNITVSFTGKDQNFWAGYYGPRVHVDSFSLLYTTNPCATNPAYSPTCSGFSSVVTSPELFDNSRWGSSVNQAIAINTALTNAGIGATVHGFKYSFDYNVGQSWSGCTATNQDGSCSWYMDIPSSVKLTASMTNSNNQSLYQKSYSLTGDGTGGTISGQYLLPSSLNQTALGSIRMSGSSSGIGSSLGNFSSNLIYTADPCQGNPLYNASCTGYAVAFAKNMLLGSTIASATGMSSPQPDTSNTAPQQTGQSSQSNQQQQTQSGPTPSDSGQQQPQQQQGPMQAAGPTANSPVTSAAPSATNPQPKPGDVQVAGSNKSNGGGSGGGSGPSALAMSVVANVQAKVNATEKSAVQQANDAATTATSQAVQLAESVAGSAQATSIASSMSSTSTASSSSKSSSNQNSAGAFSLQTNSQTSIVSSNSLKPYSPAVETVDNSSSSSVVSGLDIVRITPSTSTQVAMIQPQVASQPLQAPQQFEQPVQVYQVSGQMAQSTVNYSLSEPSTFTFDTGKKQDTTSYTEVEIVKNEGFKIGSQNPLNDYMNAQPYMSLIGNEITSDGMVKRNVQPNEVAGGVDIASMATQPKGYDAYAQMTLKDASFYKVEDIYKNQTTVDNVRLLRGLTGGSDRLHQEMVNQQFNLGK
jgi:hypothetical protein